MQIQSPFIRESNPLNKKGIGKTTSAVNLSSYIQMQGNRVCTIDLDPQGNLSSHFGAFPGKLRNKPTIYDLIMEEINEIENPKEIKQLIQNSIFHSTIVDVIPSIPRLASTANIIPSATKCEHLLEDIVSFIKKEYDYIFIDIHSGWDIFSINAMTASDSVLIPVEAHGFSEDGLTPMLGMIHTIQSKINPKLKIEGIIITKYQKITNLCNEISHSILTNYQESIRIFSDYVKYEIKVAEAPTFGISIHEYEPHSEAAKTYANIAKELMKGA